MDIHSVQYQAMKNSEKTIDTIAEIALWFSLVTPVLLMLILFAILWPKLARLLVCISMSLGLIVSTALFIKSWHMLQPKFQNLGVLGLGVWLVLTVVIVAASHAEEGKS